MKGIDTNILIRFLVGDDELQAKTVYNLFKRAEAEKKELFVPLLVMLELIWVLESVYDIPR
ncbi:MAG TPA: PIN domain-containing protein, partial [Deltaproteobacteria bacterium]|nr:PIN domain-containing protein [Deltaproteobacteria bacterium]